MTHYRVFTSQVPGCAGVCCPNEALHNGEIQKLKTQLCRSRDMRDAFERELEHYKASKLMFCLKSFHNFLVNFLCFLAAFFETVFFHFLHVFKSCQQLLFIIFSNSYCNLYAKIIPRYIQLLSSCLEELFKIWFIPKRCNFAGFNMRHFCA